MNFIYLLMALPYICLPFLWFLSCRNDRTLDIRRQFLMDQGLFTGAYEKLPHYGAMIFHPKYWRLWTKSDWVQWIERSAP